MSTTLSVVMMGAKGAVGMQVLTALLAQATSLRLTSLVRRMDAALNDTRLNQQVVDVLDPSSYQSLLGDQEVAICTLGVGQPSKMTAEEFTRIDKDALLAFATACRQAGVRHFQLLGSVGSESSSRNFYLRSKGELQDAFFGAGVRAAEYFSAVHDPDAYQPIRLASGIKAGRLASAEPVPAGRVAGVSGCQGEHAGRGHRAQRAGAWRRCGAYSVARLSRPRRPAAITAPPARTKALIAAPKGHNPDSVDIEIHESTPFLCGAHLTRNA